MKVRKINCPYCNIAMKYVGTKRIQLGKSNMIFEHLDNWLSGALPVSTDLPGVREWIDSNVGGPNVRYVPMPPMKSIDEPEDEARAGFAAELARVLKKAVLDIASGDAPGPLPDSSSITWDSVSSRLTDYFL